MPFFTLQVTTEGPMMNALVSVSGARRAALVAAGQPVPEPVTIRALVDTGASGTCVDPSVLEALALTPTGSVLVATASTGSAPRPLDQYDVAIVVPGASPNHAPLFVENIAVLSAELLQQHGFHALIGRDILSLCLLSYDGMIGAFTLAY
jgi:hypothetical protein